MSQRRAILLLALGQTLVWAALYYIFPTLLLVWEQQMGWSRAEITAAITLAVLVSAFCSPLTGRVIDHGHGAALMAGSATLGGLGLIALSRVEALWQFYAVWGWIGVAMSGSLYEPCFAIVTRARGARARGAITMITLIAGFAGTISFPSVHALSQAVGWRVTALAAGIMVIAVVAPLLWTGASALERGVRADTPATGARPLPGPRRTGLLSRPAFWLLGIGFACTALVQGATIHHLLAFLDEQRVSASMAVLAAALIGPAQVAGRLAMLATQRFASHHHTMIAVYFFMGLSMLMLLFGQGNPVALVLFIVLFGGSYGSVSILRPLIARDILGGRDFGAKSGALALPYLAGSALAPFLGAVAWGVGGYGLMFGLAAGFTALGCAMYLGAHRLSA